MKLNSPISSIMYCLYPKSKGNLVKFTHQISHQTQVYKDFSWWLSNWRWQKYVSKLMGAKPEWTLLPTALATRLLTQIPLMVFLLLTCLHKSCYLSSLPKPMSSFFISHFLKTSYILSIYILIFRFFFYVSCATKWRTVPGTSVTSWHSDRWSH